MSRATDVLGPESHRLPHLALDRVDEMLGGELESMLVRAVHEVRHEWRWTGALLDPEDVARMEALGGEISRFVKEVFDAADKREQATQAAIMTLWLRAFVNHRLVGGPSLALSGAAAERLADASLDAGRAALAAPVACAHVITAAPDVLELARDYVSVRGIEASPEIVEVYVMRLDSSRDAQGRARDAGATIDVHAFFGCKGFSAPVYAARELVVGDGTLEAALGSATRAGAEEAGDVPLRGLLRLGLAAWLESSGAATRTLESSVADRFAPKGFGKGKFEKFQKARRSVTRHTVEAVDA